MGFWQINVQKKEELQPAENTTIKCSHCFNQQVTRVCHHCGEYICEKCEPRPIRLLRQLKLYKYLFKDHEFFGMQELKREFSLSSHCRNHVHYFETVYNFLVWATVGIGLFGLLISWTLSINIGIIFGFGALAIIAFFVLLPTRGLVYRFLLANSSSSFHLFFPTKYKIEMIESMTADFRVDEKMENYLEVKRSLAGTSGKLTISLSPVPNGNGHQNEVTRANQDQNIYFSAGYLGLDNLVHVDFNQGSPLIRFKGEIVGNDTDRVNHQGKVHLIGSLPAGTLERVYQNQAALEVEHSYGISEEAGWVGPEYDREFPFWILPELSLARRELLVYIFVTPEIQEKLSLEHLSLKVPDEVIKDGMEIHGLLNTTDNGVYWVNPRLQTGINRFYVKFRKPIPHNIDFSGNYKISIDNFLISGLKMEPKGQLWFANGEPVPKPGSNKEKDEDEWLEKISKKTEFTGAFCFNTSVFKVQREFTISDQDEHRYCCPNHELIAEIARILTEGKVEIKSIIETPARIGDFRDGARLWDRYWEIRGRHYLEENLQYVEVHVVAYGQENSALSFNHKPIGWRSGPGQPFGVNVIKPEDEYKQEFVRWELHLRGETPVQQSEGMDDDYIKQLCKKLGAKIRETVAPPDQPVE